MFFIDDVKEFTNFLIKYKITPNQFYILLLRHMSKAGHNEANKCLLDYVKASGGGFALKELKDLEQKGYLFNMNPPKDHSAKGYFATEKFYSELFITTNIAGEELWNAYPDNIIINGKEVRAKTGDKDELTQMYTKKIKYSKTLHKKALEALEKDKLEGLCMGIEKWIKSEQWKNNKKEILPGYGETEFKGTSE